MRFDHIVDEPVLRGHERAREPVFEFGDFLLPDIPVFTRQLPAINDIHGAFRAHHGDLGGRPGQVHIRADVLRTHHAISAAISFARDYSDLGDRRFGERIKQLRTVADDAAELLLRAGKKAGYVLKRDQRDVERIAETHEPRSLHR